MTTDNQKPKTNNTWFLIIIILIACLGLLGMYIKDQEIQQTKTEYSIEAKLLLINIQETNKFLSKETWDLNEWIPIRNKYLEQRYNTLLEYNNPKLTEAVKQQETCLKQLITAKEAEDTELFNKIADTCNSIGENIDALLLQQLQQKIGG